MLDKDSLYALFLEIIRLHYYRTHVLLDKIGAYPGQPPLLFILNKNNGLSQKELAEKLNVKPSTITVMLRRMESGNLIYKKQDNNDQRVFRVFLTEQGRDMCNKSVEIAKLLEEECFGNFTPEEKIVLKKMLTQMRDNFKKEM